MLKAAGLPNGVFNALHSANWIRRIQVGSVRGLSANEKVRDTLVVLIRTESGAPPSAQDLKARECTARLHRLIVTPREHRSRQGAGRGLARALA